MSLYKTTPLQQDKVFEIAAIMKTAGFSTSFITNCVKHAIVYEGSHDLMVLWTQSTSQAEKDEIISILTIETKINA